MNQMEYIGHNARFDFDEADQLFVGHLVGIKDVVGFHGKTMVELETAFKESVESYIAINKERGRSPQ